MMIPQAASKPTAEQKEDQQRILHTLLQSSRPDRRKTITTLLNRPTRMDRRAAMHNLLITPTRTSKTAKIRGLLGSVRPAESNRKHLLINLLDHNLNAKKEPYIKKVKEREQILSSERDAFSIFRVINERVNNKGVLYNEEFHSGIIAFLLDSRQKHNLGNAPMRLFIRLLNSRGTYNDKTTNLNIDEHSFDDAEVKCEPWINASDGRGRIDILIQNQHNEFIIIENKIRYAGDQANQLKKYYESVINKSGHVKAIVYLSPDGHNPTDISVGDKETEINNFLVTLKTYSPDKNEPNLANDLLYALLANYDIKDVDIIAFVRQYGLFLKETTGDYMIGFDAKDFFDSISKDGVIDRDLFDTAYHIKHHLNWNSAITHHIKEKLKKMIGEKAELSNRSFNLLWRNDRRFDIEYTTKDSKFRMWIECWEIDWSRNRLLRFNCAGKRNAVMQALSKIKEDFSLSFVLWNDNEDFFDINGNEGMAYIGNEETFYNVCLAILRSLPEEM